MEIALSCDLIVSAANARFALPEAQRGVVPTCGGIFRILESLPEGMAMGVLLAGDEIDGTTAGRLGLVTRVAAEGESVAVADELADAVCRLRTYVDLRVARGRSADPSGEHRYGLGGNRRGDRGRRRQRGHASRASLPSSSAERPGGTPARARESRPSR